jgi:hypothetical protein
MMRTYLVYATIAGTQRYLGTVRVGNEPTALRWAAKRFPLLPVGSVHAVIADTESAKPYRFSDPELAQAAARAAQGEAARAKRTATIARRQAAEAARTPGQRVWWDNKRRRDRGTNGNGPPESPG